MYLPRDLIREILQYAVVDIYTIDDEKNILWWELSKQEWALDILRANPDKVEYDVYLNSFTRNMREPEDKRCYSWALPLLLENSDRLESLRHLSREPWALSLLRKCPNRDLDWGYLSTQEWALPLLLENINKIKFWYMSVYEWSLEILMKYPDKIINWTYLSSKEWALPLLLENIDNVDWSSAIYNPHVYEELKKYKPSDISEVRLFKNIRDEKIKDILNLI